MKFFYEEGATPYNQDDALYLIPKQITTQKELNEWEQQNIFLAERWLFQKRQKNILTVEFAKLLHKKMFNLTWKWAGNLRTYQTNIGVKSHQIMASLYILFDDIKFWIDNQTYPIEEIAMRFHHRLVLIHPFSNGNGRHSRLMTDALLVSVGKNRFSWDGRMINEQNSIRKSYILALKEADKGDYCKLRDFLGVTPQ